MPDLLKDGIPIIDLLQISADLDYTASHLGRHQSGVSRIYRQVSRSLDLNFIKNENGFYSASNNLAVLHYLRTASQLLRLNNPASLRWVAGLYHDWIFSQHSSFSIPLARPWFGEEQTLNLLRDRVIDLAIVSCLDVFPTKTIINSNPFHFDKFIVISLSNFPLVLSASPNHPLASADLIKPNDFRFFPSLATLVNLFPSKANLLAALGLWRNRRPILKYNWRHWEGVCCDSKTLIYTTPISKIFLKDKLQISDIKFDLSICDGDVLLVREDVFQHHVIKSLIFDICSAYSSTCAPLFANDSRFKIFTCNPALKFGS